MDSINLNQLATVVGTLNKVSILSINKMSEQKFKDIKLLLKTQSKDEHSIYKIHINYFTLIYNLKKKTK